MILFPPWMYFDGSTSSRASAGCHFILNPRRVKSYEQMFGIYDDGLSTEFRHGSTERASAGRSVTGCRIVDNSATKI